MSPVGVRRAACGVRRGGWKGGVSGRGRRGWPAACSLSRPHEYLYAVRYHRIIVRPGRNLTDRIQEDMVWTPGYLQDDIMHHEMKCIQ
jgi:hypothetical protein